MELLQSEYTPLKSGPLSDEELSWVTSIMNIGGVIGTLIFGPLADYIGRKKSLLIIAIPLIFNWLMVAFGKNMIVLLIARLLSGIAGGGIFVVLPLYISEVAQDDKRGLFSTFLILNHGIGVLIGYIAGTYLSYFATPMVSLVLPIAFAASISFFPETPQYLLTHNKSIEARKALEFLRSGNPIETLNDEFQHLVETMKKRITMNNKFEMKDFSE